MSSKPRESPSVVSTRVMKSHRMNAVESFRLQGRIRNIDHEIQHNYCQISDEIDGVRKNLVKIKNVKPGMGVSVARRKLLKEKGFRVVPASGNDYQTVILVSPDGKRTCVNSADFYSDTVPSVLQLSNLDGNGNGRRESQGAQSHNSETEFKTDKRKDFRFRVISPPLRPGSRRNFKNIEDESSDDEHDILFDPSKVIDSKTLRLVRPRAQTALNATTSKTNPKVNRRVLRRIKTCPSNISQTCKNVNVNKRTSLDDSSSDDSNDEEKELNLDETVTVDHAQSATEDCAPELKTTQEQVAQSHNDFLSFPSKQLVSRKLSLGIRQHHNVTFSHDTGTSSKLKGTSSPQKPGRKLSLDSGKTGHHDSLDTVAENNIIHNIKRSAWTDQDTAIKIVGSSKTEVSSATTSKPNPSHCQNITDGVDWIDISKSKEASEQIPKTIEPKEKKTEIDKRTRTVSYSSDTSSSSRMQKPSTLERSSSAMSNSTIMSSKTRRSWSAAKSIDENGEVVAHDNRSNKSLSKKYTTMQMTIGGRQVQVHVPKFSNASDCLDSVEQAWAKTSARSAGFRANKQANIKPNRL